MNDGVMNDRLKIVLLHPRPAARRCAPRSEHHVNRRTASLNDRHKIVLVGAGGREFGPASIRDLLLSDLLRYRGLAILNRKTTS